MTRRIVDAASTKKRDNMMGYTNVTLTNPGGIGGTYTTNSAVIPADNDARTGFKWSIYLPLAIGFDPANHLNTRSKPTVYYRGWKEVIKYETTSGLPWLHRRILFWLKDRALAANLGALLYAPQYTSNGYSRSFTVVPSTVPTNEGSVRSLLFKGNYTSDWIDPMLAAVDTNAVKLYSDTTYRISSGNDSGVTKIRKCWYPINRNFYYGYDESGSNPEAHDIYHVSGPKGPGDLLVVDFFRAHQGATSTDDLLSVRMETTLYWHEK